MKMSSEHDIEVMQEAQHKLLEFFSSYSEEDRLKVASMALKITIQVYQTMLSEKNVEQLLHYVIENVSDIKPLIPDHRTIH
jgi:hypothetical protein